MKPVVVLEVVVAAEMLYVLLEAIVPVVQAVPDGNRDNENVKTRTLTQVKWQTELIKLQNNRCGHNKREVVGITLKKITCV